MDNIFYTQTNNLETISLDFNLNSSTLKKKVCIATGHFNNLSRYYKIIWS